MTKVKILILLLFFSFSFCFAFSSDSVVGGGSVALGRKLNIIISGKNAGGFGDFSKRVKIFHLLREAGHSCKIFVLRSKFLDIYKINQLRSLEMEIPYNIPALNCSEFIFI